MGVGFERRVQRAARPGVVSDGTKQQNCLGPQMIGGAIALILIEHDRRLLVPVEIEQARSQYVTDAYIVVGIESKHVAPDRDRFIVRAAIKQAFGQTGAAAHVGTGFEDAPEVARVTREGFLAQCSFTGLDCLAVKFELLSTRPRRLGENHIGIPQSGLTFRALRARARAVLLSTASRAS